MEIRRFKPKAGSGGGESPSCGLGGCGLPRIPTPAAPRHLANKGLALLVPVLPAGSLLCAFTCASPSAYKPSSPPGPCKPSHPPLYVLLASSKKPSPFLPHSLSLLPLFSLFPLQPCLVHKSTMLDHFVRGARAWKPAGTPYKVPLAPCVPSFPLI